MIFLVIYSLLNSHDNESYEFLEFTKYLDAGGVIDKDSKKLSPN